VQHPDETHKEMRELADKLLTQQWSNRDAVLLAEKVKALDEWLLHGGFLPKPWHDVMVARVLT